MKRWVLLFALLGLSCAGPSDDRLDGEEEPSTEVDVVDPTQVDPEERPADQDAILSELSRSENWTPDDFLQHHETSFVDGVSYHPPSAEFLDLVWNSSFALTDEEKDRLAADGFAVTNQQFPSFAYGYETIYAEDLPVYISADSILYAVHRSFDDILKELERDSLIPKLRALLESMRTQLGAGAAAGLSADSELDLDLYLAVALSLLDGSNAAPVAGANSTLIDEYFGKATAASGYEERVVFGSKRKVDFSQFKPRGHYTDSEELERYFRAMTWLGRIDFRMLEPDGENKLQFHRRQFYGTVGMAELLTAQGASDFDTIDSTIGGFVGEPDNMLVTQVDGLLEALGAEDAADTKSIDDATIATVIQKYRFGSQRISSHFMVNGIRGTTAPLSHSFALFGQRYVIDSHVFSNVVYDRAGEGEVTRMMPDPLDVGFAALKNDQAGMLLEPQLREYDYQHDLQAMRVLADNHGEDFWSANLYNLWLESLRALSPSDEVSDPASGLPDVARTDAWGRRMLNTQMASWAELRHDTILYAKQSYTNGAACEFPDAYVEPYPEFFAAIVEFAAKGIEVSKTERVDEYFDTLRTVATRLESMAKVQRTGMPHSTEDVVWINEAVSVVRNCDDTPLGLEGWYGDLFYNGREIDYDPTIADVHTQPTDEVGNAVGKVLHVGTGMPRAMVVTVDTCVGPRAYVGIVSSYHEEITDDFKRLNDEDWAPKVTAGQVTSPDWAP